MPRVSVIIPAYIDDPDKLVWFGEALESLKNQTFTDWEAIIVDDYSPVDIGEVKYRFEADERFRWFKTSHNYGGPAMVRNTAVALAESEAILPLDADDQLGSNETLERMYQAWQADKTRIVYGNLQRYPLEDGKFVKRNVVQLGEYTFDRVINPQGLFPVTAMHSIDCHAATGGWRPELDAGFEDLEYWIAAGERGFCGHWIKHTTLIYRSYDASRYHKMRIAGRNAEMTAKIVSMHKDVYDGRYPMACCNKANSTTSTNSNPAGRAVKVTTLEDFRPDEKIWIKYQGLKQGSFELAADQTSPVAKYIVQGAGHVFEIHRYDEKRFRSFAETFSIDGKSSAERQSSYIIGVPSPIEPEPEIEVVEATPPRQIELAEIERYDNVAMATRGIEPEPEAQPQAANGPVVIEQQQPLTQTYDLSELGLSPALQGALEGESWTLEKLSSAEANELTPYKTVGIKRANAIIASAQRVLNG